MKQHAQTKQTQPTKKSNETQTNQMKPKQTHGQMHTHDTTERERSQEEKRV